MNYTLHRNLIKINTWKYPPGIVEDKFDAGAIGATNRASRPTFASTIPNQILTTLATERFDRLLTQNKPESLGRIGLARTIGTDNTCYRRRKMKGRLPGE